VSWSTKKKRGADDTQVDLVPSGAQTLPREANERVGSVVAGRFRLDAVLGAGGMGAVFDGIDAQTGQRVAVKLLHDRFADNDQHIVRFLHEARVMRRIAHTGIPVVLDAGRDERGRAYIALERLEGRDLSDVLDDGPLGAKEVVVIGHQLLAILAAVHAHGVIHRDVKPENIFIGTDAHDATRVKLLDFGIAKVHGVKAPPDAVRTLDGVRLGTPHFMSPEQWRGEELSERSDVWAAGAVLFTATMGYPPYDAEDLGILSGQITTTAAPSLAVLRPQIGPAFTDTIDRALKNDPRARYANARAMAAALHEGGIRVDGLDWDE
jgi:serine/threonine protein kinase